MPFDSDNYRDYVRELSDVQLHNEYRKYCSDVGKAGTGYFLGLLFAVPTLGLSAIGSAGCAAQGTNAGIKIDIINDEKNRRARL